MQFSDESIEQLQTLYKNHFGQDIDRKTAFECAEKLCRAVELTYVKISVDDFEKLQARRKETEKIST